MSLRRSLDTMGTMVERASSVPLSASCMVNRAEMLALVERARAELPVELDQAAELLVAHQEVIARAEVEAEEILAQARSDAERLLAESALVTSARSRSEQILDAARAEAARLLRECDLYCDNRLSSFENDLERAMGQIRRGRDRLRERSELDSLEPLPGDDGLEHDPGGYAAQVGYEEAGRRQRARERERARWAGEQAYDHEAETADGKDALDPYDQESGSDRAGSGQEPVPDTSGDHRDDAQVVSGDGAVGGTRPAATVPTTTEPEATGPEAMGPDVTVPDATVPDATVPGTSTSGATTPEPATVGSAGRDGAGRDGADRDGAVPGGAAPAPRGTQPGPDREQPHEADRPGGFDRIPAGVGAGRASGPERRVLDLTAVERAVEPSGLG